MRCPLHNRLAQKGSVASFPHNVRISSFVLHIGNVVTDALYCQDRYPDLAVKNNVLAEVADCCGVGGDACSAIERFDVRLQAQSSLLIERLHLCIADRALQLLFV